MDSNLHFSAKELNSLALEHLKNQGIDITDVQKELEKRQLLPPERDELPEWHKSEYNNFSKLYSPKEHELQILPLNITHEDDSRKEKIEKNLPSFFGRVINLTKKQYPFLHIPSKPSIFDSTVLNPESFVKQIPINPKTHTHLFTYADKNNSYTEASIPISTRIANREIGRSIPSMVERTPSLYTSAQHMITIEGHVAAAYCVTFDKTGRRIITASDDRTIKIWSVYNGVLLYTLRGHEGEIIDISVDPFNRFIASASNDTENQIRIWSLGESFGLNLTVLKGHLRSITVVSFNPSPLNNYLLTSDIGGKICLWNYNNWDDEPITFQQEYEISTAVWDLSGTRFATGGGSHICIYTIEGLVLTLPSPDISTFMIRSIQWCPHYNGIGAGSHDGSVYFWKCDSNNWEDSNSWEMIELLERTSTRTRNDRIEGVSMLQFTTDGNYMISAHVNESTLKVWCTRTCQKLYDYSPHRSHVFTILPHPVNPRLVVTAGYDGLVTIFDVLAGKLIRAYMINVQVTDGAFSCSSGNYFAFTSLEGCLSIFGVGSKENYKDTPKSQFFASEQNPLVYDTANNIAIDAVLNIPPCEAPREIGDKLGRVHENIPLALLGPISYYPDENCNNNNNQPLPWKELSKPMYNNYIRNIEISRKDIIHDGTIPDNVDELFPIIEVQEEEEAPMEIDEPSSPEEEDPIEDDDDDDWEGSFRVASAASHTLQTRRRTYAAQQSESDSEDDLHTSVSTSTVGGGGNGRRNSGTKRYPEWVTTVKPIRNAYIPQIYDEVIYFVEGHEQYMNAYRERENPLIPIVEPYAKCRVEDIKIVSVNYRRYRTKARFELSLRLIHDDSQENNEEGELFTVYYHPLSKCPDFLILSSLFDYCSQQSYIGKRFRMFYPDNVFYYGRVINVGTQNSSFDDSPWESLEVEWDNNDPNNDNHLSCWEIELIPSSEDDEINDNNISTDENTSESEDGDINMVDSENASEIQPIIPEPTETEESDFEPMDSDSSPDIPTSPSSSPQYPSTEQQGRTTRSRTVAETTIQSNEPIIEEIGLIEPESRLWLRDNEHVPPETIDAVINCIQQLHNYRETAEFLYPIDLQTLPTYYTVILSAIDLTSISERLQNDFYRRKEAIIEDIKLLEHNALVFNGASSWFYEVAHIIKETLKTVINTGVWEEPNFPEFFETQVEEEEVYEDEPIQEITRNPPQESSRRRGRPSRRRSQSHNLDIRRSSRTRRPVYRADSVFEGVSDNSTRPGVRRSARFRRSDVEESDDSIHSSPERHTTSSQLSRSDDEFAGLLEEFRSSSSNNSSDDEHSPPKRSSRRGNLRRQQTVYYNSISSDEELPQPNFEDVSSITPPTRTSRRNTARISWNGIDSSSEDEEILIGENNTNGHRRAASVDISGFTSRTRRPPVRFADESQPPSSTGRNSKRISHKYSTRGRTDADSLLIEPFSDPIPKRRSTRSSKKIIIEDEEDDEEEEEVNTSKKQYDSEEDTYSSYEGLSQEKEMSPGDISEYDKSEEEDYEEDMLSPRRSRRERKPRKVYEGERTKSNLRKRSRSHPSAPPEPTRRSKRQRTSINYNFDNEDSDYE